MKRPASTDRATRSHHAELPVVQLYTDGACSGNPGPGGWAYLLRHLASGREKQAWDAEPETTNNRMELTAVIRGLSALKRRCRVELYTDSEYVGKGLRDWLPKWKANGWRRRDGKSWAAIKNEDLWRQLDALLQKHDVVYHKVLGHSGHEENELVDRQAVAAYQKYVNR